MNQTEKDLRIDLAACYRIFDFMGWSEMIYNHISIKLPGEQEHFLLNPYGLHYSEVTASSLVKVDLQGNIVEETPHQVNQAGIIIHTAIHEAREDIACIGHLHTDAGMAVACTKEGLRNDNFYSVLLAGQVAYHPFEGITVNPGEKERLVANLGQADLLILRNHGLLAGGKSIAEMFQKLWGLQRACEIQVATDQTGRELQPIEKSVVESSQALLKMQMAGNDAGALEFAAFKRLVTAKDDSFIDL